MSYKADSIKVLKGLDPVRARPGMYIGNVDDAGGLHQTAFEIIDNAVDEAINGYCDFIIVTIGKDGYLTVKDNGRGVPFDMHPTEKKPAVDVIFTILHAGGKFDNNSYKTSGGLHGVGASVVNALSEYLIVESRRDGKCMTRKYKRGVPVGTMRVVEGPKRSGTMVSFKPDAKIFKDTTFQFSILKERLEEVSFLNDNLKVRLIDERSGEVFEAKYANGLVAYVKSLEQKGTPLNGIIQISKTTPDGIEVHCAMQWKSGIDTECIVPFTNTIKNVDGGTHVIGFKNALTRTVNKYMADKRDANLVTSDDIRAGLVAVLDLRMSSPQFSSQVKSKLVSDAARAAVESIAVDLENYFEQNPAYISKICTMSIAAARAREAAKSARDLVRQSATSLASPLTGKLADCQSRKPADCELFIVEGDSAGGTSKQGRDRKYQAILPLRGKILNAEKAGLKKLLDNNEIQSLVAAIGTGIGKNFDIDKLRYHKVCIMTDADSVTGDTPILVEIDGALRYMPIADLVNDMELHDNCNVLSCDTSKGTFSSNKVEQFISHGTDKQLYRIETEEGYVVKTTGDHNIFIHDGESIVCVPTSRLKPKDAIIAPAKLPRKDAAVSFGHGRGRVKLTALVAAFIGMCLGGSIKLFANRAEMTLNASWRVDRITRTIHALGGSWRVLRDERGYHITIGNGTPLTIIRALSLDTINRVPDEIYNADRRTQLSFLNGYFSSAGCVSKHGDDHYSFACHAANDMATSLLVVLRQMSLWPRIYRSDTHALIEMSNKSIQHLMAMLKGMTSKHPHYRLLKIKSVTPIDNDDNVVYDLSVPAHQNFVAGEGGLLLHNTDGEHIRVLLLTFFYRFMIDLIRRGHIFVAQPPLYRCVWGNTQKYALNDDELNAIKIDKRFGYLQVKRKGAWTGITALDAVRMPSRTPIKSEKAKGVVPLNEMLEAVQHMEDIKIQRFKGLGEMSDEQLWTTTLNPNNRRLVRIMINDAEAADKMVTLLMGNDVESRKQYILDHCESVDLDV
jgi:DNA gyrase/topoisomerase IV subunit B